MHTNNINYFKFECLNDENFKTYKQNHVILLSMNEFELCKNSSNNFTIKLSKPNKALLMSLCSHIDGLSVSSEYNACSFNSVNVETFDKFIESQKKLNGTIRLRYEFVETLVRDICRQVSYLIETHRKCFCVMQTKNIIVIDNGSKFLYVSNNELLDIKDNSICIRRPFAKDQCFLSSELASLNELPYTINYNTTYCSIGELATFCLTGERTSSDIEDIYGTKLYFCVKRLVRERCFVNL